MLTFLGDAVFGRDIAVFSGTFLAVMARLGITEEATRSTLTRMVSRGLLERHRRGRKMYFALAPRATAVLADARRRLWEMSAANTDDEGRWTLLGFSVPESRRDERHLLRSRLRWAGFGLLRSGLWIAPGTVDVTSLVQEIGLLDHVQVFRAEPAEPTAVGQMVRDAYDLPAIATHYQDFLRRWNTPHPLPEAPDDLARVLWLISEWLVVLREDPRIPLQHLPADWPALAAQGTFHDRYEQLEPNARHLLATLIDSIELPPAPH